MGEIMITQNAAYLRAIHCIDLPDRERKIPRERYEKYNDDLYKLHGKELTRETFHEGGQYTYTELGDALLEMEIVKPFIKQLDLIILAHWSQEFDPDYAVCVPYFLAKHKIKADTFDIFDCGTIAPFLAIKLMLQYQSNQLYKNGMILCLEQSTVPRRKADGDIIPQRNGALGLFFSMNVFHKSCSVICAGVFSDKETISMTHRFAQFFKFFFLEHLLEIQTTKIVLRKGTLIWKLLNYAIQTQKIDLKEEQILFIEPIPGCLTAMKALADVMNDSLNYAHILLIDEDVESLLISYVILGECYV